MKLPFLVDNKPTGEIYCGILLKEGQGICYVYEKKPSSVVLLKQKEFQYSDQWEHVVDDIDDALSHIEQELGKNTPIAQCIFFVFAHLIDHSTHEIAKPYIGKLRDISKLLELRPVGYMEVVDAVAEELEKEKQTRLSSIVAELDDTQLTVFLFKGGHKLAIQQSVRTDNFAADMQESLEKIAQSHILPNHIYLYDSTDLAEESSDLLLYSWKKDLFIQQPRIAVVPAATVSNALLGLLEKQLCEKPQVVEEKTEETPSEVMGFVVGGEVSDGDVQERPSSLGHRIALPKIVFPHLPFIKILPLVILPLLLIGLIGSLLFFAHKATISILVPTERKTAEIDIVASEKPTQSTQVQLQTFTVPFSANEKKQTTGKRDVGEKAAGEVTLYSYEEKDKQIPKATVLHTDSLSFETDDVITIPASAFAGDGITKNPGKAKVKVHASVLGSESNIDKNKRFSVAGNSSNIVFGINELPLTGGTKKTVKTISKNDMDSLKTAALDAAKKGVISKQTADNLELFLPELTTIQPKTEKYSGEVGEEAESITYVASGNVSLYEIPKKAITDFVEKRLANEKPADYKIDSVNFTVNKQQQLKTGGMQLTIGGEIVFSKILDEKKIAEAAKGMTVLQAQDTIKSQFGISSVEVQVVPALPLFKDRVPYWAEHIRIQLKH